MFVICVSHNFPRTNSASLDDCIFSSPSPPPENEAEGKQFRSSYEFSINLFIWVRCWGGEGSQKEKFSNEKPGGMSSA